jgi:hypothetical protein
MTVTEQRSHLLDIIRRYEHGATLSRDELEYVFALARHGCLWLESEAQHETEQRAAWQRIQAVR